MQVSKKILDFVSQNLGSAYSVSPIGEKDGASCFSAYIKTRRQVSLSLSFLIQMVKLPKLAVLLRLMSFRHLRKIETYLMFSNLSLTFIAPSFNIGSFLIFAQRYFMSFSSNPLPSELSSCGSMYFMLPSLNRFTIVQCPPLGSQLRPTSYVPSSLQTSSKY